MRLGRYLALAFLALSQVLTPATAQVIAPITAINGSSAPLTGPPVVPPGDHGRLGIGVTMAYWDSSHMWIDVLKADFQPWIVGYQEPHPFSPGEWIFRGAEFDTAGMEAAKDLYDANGYPTELPDIYEEPNRPAMQTFGFVDQRPADTTINGRYVLIWDGEGELELSNLQPGSIVNLVETDHRIEFDLVQQPEGLTDIRITVTDIDPLDHFRDMHMYRLEWEALFEAGNVVSPLWIEHFGTVKTVRFMDMTKTNSPDSYVNYGPTIGHANSWATRAHPDDFNFGLRGIPIEWVVKFGNETGINVWYTIPFFSFDVPWEYIAPPAYVYPTGPLADPEDFTRPLAEYVEANLSEDVIFYLELGNELWNFPFPSTQRLDYERLNDPAWCDMEANCLGNWQEYASMLAIGHMDVLADVFTGQMERVRRMGCSQGEYYAQTDWWFQSEFVETFTPGNQPQLNFFDGKCWNAYFYPQLNYAEELIDRLEDPMYTDEDVREWYAQHFYDHIDGTGPVDPFVSLEAQMLYHDGVAEELGLESHLYEGGRHNTSPNGTSNDALIAAFLTEFNVSEEAGEVYAHWISVYDANQPVGVYKSGVMQFLGITREDYRQPFFAMRYLGDSNPVIDKLLEYNAGLFP